MFWYTKDRKDTNPNVLVSKPYLSYLISQIKQKTKLKMNTASTSVSGITQSSNEGKIDAIINNERMNDAWKKITTASLTIYECAMIIKEELFNSGYLHEEWTYDHVIGDKTLMQYMLRKLGEGLPITIKGSKFGLNLVSDYDLYFRCNNNANMKIFMNGKRLSEGQQAGLNAQYKVLNRHLGITRKEVILAMDFNGTPNFEVMNYMKKKEKEKKESKRKSADEILNSEKKKANHGSVEEDEQRDAENSSSTGLTVAMNVVTIVETSDVEIDENLVNHLIDKIPEMNTKGCFVCLNSDRTKLVWTTNYDWNTETCRSVFDAHDDVSVAELSIKKR